MLRIKRVIKNNSHFILFIVLLFVCRSSIADWYHVPSGSMLPTIIQGDRIWVDKMAYRLDIPFTDIGILRTGEPQRGDIVTFNSATADKRLIKRIVGIPGDRVAMLDNQLYLNGTAVKYVHNNNHTTEFLTEPAHRVQWTGKPSTVNTFAYVDIPADHYLVLGDNRNHSADSRVYGLVPRSELSGKATHVIASFDLDNFYRPRASRWLYKLI